MGLNHCFCNNRVFFLSLSLSVSSVCIRLILCKMKSFSNFKDLIEGVCQISCEVTLDVQLKKKLPFFQKKKKEIKRKLAQNPFYLCK